MSFEKVCHGYEMECNSCYGTLNIESYSETRENFMDAILHAKDEGWKIKKIKGKWKHYCLSCVKKSGDENK